MKQVKGKLKTINQTYYHFGKHQYTRNNTSLTPSFLLPLSIIQLHLHIPPTPDLRPHHTPLLVPTATHDPKNQHPHPAL